MLVSFCIRKYEDEVLCDVVLMQVGHLLLGRPWQFDRHVKHDDFTNKYSFVLNQMTITLVPLSPKQVYEDQVRLKKESEIKRAVFLNQPMIILLYKEASLNTNKLDVSLPSSVVSLL